MEVSLTIFNALSIELVRLGEDAAEFSFWRDIFESLSSEEKEKLINNLTKELQEFKRIKKQ